MNKRNILILSCLLCMSGSLFAQELSIKYNEKGKAGYADASGTLVIPCNYDAVFPFENGLGRVMKGEKLGLVDAQGNVVVTPQWDDLAYDKEHNLYRVKKGKNYGILDGKGNVLVQAKYSYISGFNRYGKALLAVGGKSTPNQQMKGKNYLMNAKYGVLNADGTIAIEAKWKGLYEFTNAVASNTVGYGMLLKQRRFNIGDTLITDCEYVGYDSKGWFASNAGVMDAKGNIVVKPNVAQYIFLPKNGMARYYTFVKKQAKFEVGYINLSTQVKTKMTETNSNGTQYTESTDFMDNIAAVAQNGAWNFYDTNLNLVFGGYKTLAKGSTSGMWCAWKTDGTCEFFDVQGKKVFDGAGYTDVFFPRNQEGTEAEYIAVKKDGMWGLVNKENVTKIPFEYEKVNDVRYGWVPVKKGGKWGMLSIDGQEIVPAAYEDITSTSAPNTKALYVKKSDKLWYVYNVEKKKEVSKGYKGGGYFVDGIAWVKPDNMKVEDNSVYRALDGGTGVNSENFGYVIDEEGNQLVTVPVPTNRIAEIRDEIIKKGKRQLTKSEMKNMLLRMSVRSRHYQLNTPIDESNWDY